MDPVTNTVSDLQDDLHRHGHGLRLGRNAKPLIQANSTANNRNQAITGKRQRRDVHGKTSRSARRAPDWYQRSGSSMRPTSCSRIATLRIPQPTPRPTPASKPSYAEVATTTSPFRIGYIHDSGSGICCGSLVGGRGQQHQHPSIATRSNAWPVMWMQFGSWEQRDDLR